MSIFLDPHQGKLQRWRILQNIILTIYMDSWFALSEEEREDLPYRFVLAKPIAQLLDKQGVTVAEFESLEGNLHVHWVRSHADLERLDDIGQALSRAKEVVE